MDEEDDMEDLVSSIFIVIKKEEFVDLVQKYTQDLNNDIEELKRKYVKDGKKETLNFIKACRKAIKYNEGMIKVSDKDDDYLLYYLDYSGGACFLRVTKEYKKRVYDLDRESEVAYA